MSARKIGAIDLRWKEPLGNPECPHAYRWALIVFGYGLRLHHWLKSDDDRAFHDHPWWMLIRVISGRYADYRPDGTAELVLPGKWYFRPADHKHIVIIPVGNPPEDVWTLVITGPKVRNWGFWIPGRDKLLRPLRYFSRFGHHQCD